jgi:arginine decarboxylase
MPITRLNEKLEQSGVIMDLTCDSDGCLSKFVDKRDVKKSLLLHTPKQNEPYFIGFFLVGAYQEALGNNHNLFGAVNEVIVSIDKNGNITQFDTVEGEDVGEILRIMNYDEKSVIEGYKKQLNRQLKGNHISKADYDSVLLKIKSFLSEYPYLMTKEKMEIVG